MSMKLQITQEQRIASKANGFKEISNVFDALIPTNVNKYNITDKVGILSDGTKVVARPGSKTGGAILEIKVSNSKIYKIRY